MSISTTGISGINAGFNKAKGEIKENSTTYNQNSVTAKDTLSIESGKDTHIIGSKVSGDTVKADIGGNLNIESLQEKETYDEKNTSSGMSISIDLPQGGKTGSKTGIQGSASKGKIESDYKSVTDQAGIYAGEGGFDIHVGKNTDLKGAVIASEATPDKNKIRTGTLTYSDIQNKAEYSSSSIGAGFGFGYGSLTDDKGNVITDKDGKPVDNPKNGSSYTPGISVNGSASSTTKSGISLGIIEIRNNPSQDISNLSRNPEGALNALGKIFDKKTVQKQQELTNLFSQEAFHAIGDLASSQRKKALEEAAAAQNAGNTTAYNEAIARADSWAEGGSNKILLHAIAGGLVSQLSGNGFTTGATSAGLNEAAQSQLAKIKDSGLHQLASAVIGAAAAKVVGGNTQVGASVAVSATTNNWLSHTQQEDFADKLKAALDANDVQEIKRLLAEYTALSQYNDQYVYNLAGKLEATDEKLETQLLRLGPLSNNGLNVNLTNLSSRYGLNEQVALEKNNFIRVNNNGGIILSTPSSIGSNPNYVVEQTKLRPATPPAPEISTGDQWLNNGDASLGYEKSTGLAIAIKADGTVEYAPGKPCRGDVLAEQPNAYYTQINGKWFVVDPEDPKTCWITNKTPSAFNDTINKATDTFNFTVGGFLAITAPINPNFDYRKLPLMDPNIYAGYNFVNGIGGLLVPSAQTVGTYGPWALGGTNPPGTGGFVLAGSNGTILVLRPGIVLPDGTTITNNQIAQSGENIFDGFNRLNASSGASNSETGSVANKGSGKAASIEDILKGANESTNGKGIARNFDKSGGFEQTLKDFESMDLDPSTVKDIQTQYGPGKVGKLRDGTTVVARPGSNTGGSTLEITVSNSKVYKVRY